MAAIYARLGDGNASLECLDILSRASLLPNLFTLHDDWRGMGLSMNMATAPVQLDANLGWVNAIQEQKSPLGEQCYLIKMKCGDQPVIFEAEG